MNRWTALLQFQKAVTRLAGMFAMDAARDATASKQETASVATGAECAPAVNVAPQEVKRATIRLRKQRMTAN